MDKTRNELNKNWKVKRIKQEMGRQKLKRCCDFILVNIRKKSQNSKQ